MKHTCTINLLEQEGAMLLHSPPILDPPPVHCRVSLPSRK